MQTAKVGRKPSHHLLYLELEPVDALPLASNVLVELVDVVEDIARLEIQ